MRHHVNLGTTSLLYQIDSSATTIFVADGSVLPQTCPFDLRINQGGLDEYVTVTAISVNQLTVVRGSEGGRFTAKDHLAGVPVRQVLTASAIAELTGTSGSGTTTELGPVICLRREFAAGGPTSITITTDSFRVLRFDVLVTEAVDPSTCSLLGTSVDTSVTGRRPSAAGATVESSGSMVFTKSSAAIAGEVLIYAYRR